MSYDDLRKTYRSHLVSVVALQMRPTPTPMTKPPPSPPQATHPCHLPYNPVFASPEQKNKSKTQPHSQQQQWLLPLYCASKEDITAANTPAAKSPAKIPGACKRIGAKQRHQQQKRPYRSARHKIIFARAPKQTVTPSTYNQYQNQIGKNDKQRHSASPSKSRGQAYRTNNPITPATTTQKNM
ncbi:MAG: hypothetical protein ACI8V2_004160 [Candidatus Latescibacterota bacterium]|jgi:hypothetical protein